MSYFWALLFAGSPPPTRGTLKNAFSSAVYLRITPAYAGNTLEISLSMRYFGDHPRLRGEHIRFFDIRFACSGSPPPTQGTRNLRKSINSCSWITPAYAGNTYRYYCRFHVIEDHPRLRGEHWSCLQRCNSSIGITPAYAGNTYVKIGINKSNRDHPRLCGEHGMPFCAIRLNIGSPPPMRGTHVPCFFKRLIERITPAYAGNTL